MQLDHFSVVTEPIFFLCPAFRLPDSSVGAKDWVRGRREMATLSFGAEMQSDLFGVNIYRCVLVGARVRYSDGARYSMIGAVYFLPV